MACLQAVEQGKLSLDDAEQIKKLCPELADVKVLKDDGTLEDKKTDITLRMLLSHMSGFGYELYVQHPLFWEETIDRLQLQPEAEGLWSTSRLRCVPC
jgi:CubicO group peptidase (beta-lactamase class C family)